jgi:DNA-binding MarR family transcriptional regulator
VKVQTILLLYVEPQLTDRQIYARLKYSPAILSSVLKSCVKYGLAENKQGRYGLTRVGRKVAEFLIELTETAKEELWKT